MVESVKIFISYAHEDEAYKDELEKFLSPLQRNNDIEIWDDRDIIPGQEWDSEIRKALYDADILLFLISPDFMASNYINDIEIKHSHERHQNGGVILIPIIIRTTDWFSLEMSKFQALPKNAKPISTWDDKDAAWTDVVTQLKRTIESLKSGETQLSKKVSSSVVIPQILPTQNGKSVTNTITNDTKGKIKKLIREDKIKKAIDDLFEIPELQHSGKENDLILLASRFNGLQNDLNQNTISKENAGISQARIKSSLLSLIEDIFED